MIGLEPIETVRAFEARDELRTTVKWSEMWHDDHARAFTVAKIAKLDLLQDIQASLADVLANGGTFEQWQANILPTLQKAGWWGIVEDRDLTGADHPVTVGPRRLRTIFDTNLRMSRAAGRWARIQELKRIRPYLRYVAVMDRRTRPEHRRWHGVVLPVDHPWWDTHFPPCGWGCRCTVRQLSDRDLAAKGYEVTKTPPDDGQRLFYPAGRTEPVAVPVGIDPGFAYNPGKASMRAVAEKAIRTLERTAPFDLSAARSTLDTLVQSDAFLETLEEPGALFPVMILDDRVRGALQAENHVVALSSDTFAKQQGQTKRSAGHADLTVAEYRLLPAIGAAPEHVFQDRDKHIVLLKTVDGRLFRAVVKVTNNRREMYLQSFRRADPGEPAKLLRKHRDLLS